MKRPLVFLIVFVAGCSTAPVADLMDYFSPGRMGPESTPPYGGVSAPHPGGSSLPSEAVSGPGLPPVPPVPPAGGAALTGPVAPPPPGSFGPPPAGTATPPY
jgi:hypothetical protein